MYSGYTNTDSNRHSTAIYIDYMIDETEGIFVIIPFFLIYTIFILWGVVLGIAALLR